ncbi:MAG: hypothetical protein M0R02_15360, partial [Bacteroidales bacterium]|nr:hypothetical protein [Bacteroidales bacterium]
AAPAFVVEGRADFVISHIQYALSRDEGETGACPDGLSKADRDRGNRGAVFIGRPDLQQRKDESEAEFGSRIASMAYQPDVKNLCINPEMGSPDPDYHSVSGETVPVRGINLTGHVARRDEEPLPGMCAYDSFVGFDGELGIDNQFYRVVGCTRGYQPTGLANKFATEMLTGSWGVLLSIDGLDDLRNDDHVEVGIYANSDPIVLSPDRLPLGYASYTPYEDTRYHTSTTGRIVDGVLTTEPVDVRFFSVLNGMYIDQVLRDARLQVTFDEEGVVRGYLAGYAPVENAYDVNFGYRDARAGHPGSPELGPYRTRTNSAIGKSNHMGYTCAGIYHALHEHADGHLDPETGRCTSISTQFQIEGVPAFVVGISSRARPTD